VNAALRLSARNAWVNRGRSAMTVLAVVLSVGFMAAVLMLSGGLSKQSDSGVSAAYQKVSFVVHGQKVLSNPPGEYVTQSGTPVPAEVLSAVRAAPGVTAAQGLRSGYAVLERADGAVIGHPGTGGGVGQSWLGNSPLNPYRLLAGQAPKTSGQAALDRAAATESGVSIGQRLTLITATGHHPVTIVGIVGYGSADGPFDTTAVLLAADASRSLLGVADSYDQILVRARPGSQAALTHAVAPWNAQVQTGAAFAAAEHTSIGSTLSFGRVFLYGFAIVALLAGGTLIFNTFSVTIAQRARAGAGPRAGRHRPSGAGYRAGRGGSRRTGRLAGRLSPRSGGSRAGTRRLLPVAPDTLRHARRDLAQFAGTPGASRPGRHRAGSTAAGGAGRSAGPDGGTARAADR
jgi:putative ABC transport system permease protein